MSELGKIRIGENHSLKPVEPGIKGSPSISYVRGNLWTSSQRRSNSLHEISYRACFKAELPRFFISRFTRDGDHIYDPFMGRGTTVLETALLKRVPIGVDLNPLSMVMASPRLNVPPEEELIERVRGIPLEDDKRAEIDLSMFFDPRTESEIVGMKDYLKMRRKSGEEDSYDRFIRMVATNRLTGHSKGFFSVYTLPPNQAVSQESQIRINERLNQKPAYRDTRELIARKIHSLLRDFDGTKRDELNSFGFRGKLFIMDARDTSSVIPDNSVRLTVTSPPFLNVVDYRSDNWLRLWFNGIDNGQEGYEPFITSSLKEWRNFISEVFSDLYRVTIPGGRVAFEVGEIRKGEVNLEEYVAEAGREAGFVIEAVYVNEQKFTKTSNIWGIKNNRDGTNTNRIALFRKP